MRGPSFLLAMIVLAASPATAGPPSGLQRLVVQRYYKSPGYRAARLSASIISRMRSRFGVPETGSADLTASTLAPAYAGSGTSETWPSQHFVNLTRLLVSHVSPPGSG